MRLQTIHFAECSIIGFPGQFHLVVMRACACEKSQLNEVVHRTKSGEQAANALANG